MKRGAAAELESSLLATIDAGFRRIAERAGAWLVCKEGCADCCHGPFPVTALDARRLRRGLESLAGRDRLRADAILRRASQARVKLSQGYPGEAGTGRLTDDEPTLDRFFAGHAGLACPVLDPATGRCELHESRPVACRTYGPPLEFGGRRAAHCPLCFKGAEAGTVEACRWEPDPAGIEDRLVAGSHTDPYHTLIAFVFRR